MISNDICRVPVTAVYTVYRGSSEPVMTSAEYAEISADTIARFLIERFGADAILEGKVSEWQIVKCPGL